MAKQPQLDADIIQCRADLLLARERLLRKANIINVATENNTKNTSSAVSNGVSCPELNLTKTESKNFESAIDSAKIIEVKPLDTSKSYQKKDSPDREHRSEIPSFSLNTELLSRDRQAAAAKRVRPAARVTASNNIVTSHIMAQSAKKNADSDRKIEEPNCRDSAISDNKLNVLRGIEAVIKDQYMISADNQNSLQIDQQHNSEQNVSLPEDFSAISLSNPTFSVSEAESLSESFSASVSEPDDSIKYTKLTAKNILENASLSQEERHLLSQLGPIQEDQQDFDSEIELINDPQTEYDKNLQAQLEAKIGLNLESEIQKEITTKLNIDCNNTAAINISKSLSNQNQNKNSSKTDNISISALFCDYLDEGSRFLISEIVSNDISAHFTPSNLSSRRTCKYAAF